MHFSKLTRFRRGGGQSLLPLLATGIVVALVTAMSATAAVPQPRQDQRNQFMDGVLKNLVDSGMRFQGSPLAPVPPAANISNELRQARQLVANFATQCDQLIVALQREERYAPAVRTLLGDALSVKAYADVLAQRSQGMTELRQLHPEFQQLDSQWRLLSHRIQQLPNVARSVLTLVSQLDQAEGQLGQLLSVAPQLETDDLTHHFQALAADLDNLQQDVRIDLYNLPDRDQILTNLYRLTMQVQYLQNLVQSNRGGDIVVEEYKRFRDAWLPVKNKLRAVDNRFVQRNLNRIAQENERVGELLWLPKVIDGNEILFLARNLKKDVDSFCDQVSLTEVMQRPNAPQVVTAAYEFYGLCTQFSESVASQTKLDDLLWDFRALEVSWNDVRQLLGTVSTQERANRLALMEQSMAGLRQSLGIRPVVDYENSLYLASSLDNMADLLEYNITRMVSTSGSYSAQFRQQAQNSARAFHNQARTLHASVAQRADESTLRQQSLQLTDQWNQLQGFISQLQAADRNLLIGTVRDTAPVMAKLQVLFAY